MADDFDLERFTAAQEGIYDNALAELEAGRKRTHWMWFVFPQLRGLGLSQTSRFYGLASLDEARAYLAHPLLGARLAACTRAVLAHRDRSAQAIFGSPDDIKLRSSMTLFDRADAGADNIHRAVLDRFFSGEDDPLTLALLQRR
ncbi:DUF1810 domain-containing protein [Bosea sp. (in: a-proteobacteria)]|uniref:DUF1810 domain-containing protein n=1 Tax=Bosea sp. (in: a-proteobacteria) TaxID=1871050 RepID=UPI001ACF036A|nr:DUF1810 domain-containing protein [Bosea sp. (in: a-proteobacteria)]MBN9441362.1 DUF1810 domain-containing protein [Bosea sp. (in: a-proteobacteria)]